MKKLELGKRIMLELIDRKYAENKSKEIRIDENDFRGDDTSNKWYSPTEITDILLALEQTSRGRIKLQSVTPRNNQPKNYSDSGVFGGAKTKYPNYFYINYEPFAIAESFKGKAEVLTLSRAKGLCRIIDGKTICYPIRKQRFNIISSLEKHFITSKELAKLVGTTPQKLSVQIGDIREKIFHKLNLNGNDVIETSDTRAGYRIGKKIKINIKQ